MTLLPVETTSASVVTVGWGAKNSLAREIFVLTKAYKILARVKGKLNHDEQQYAKKANSFKPVVKKKISWTTIVDDLK